MKKQCMNPYLPLDEPDVAKGPDGSIFTTA